MAKFISGPTPAGSCAGVDRDGDFAFDDGIVFARDREITPSSSVAAIDDDANVLQQTAAVVDHEFDAVAAAPGLNRAASYQSMDAAVATVDEFGRVTRVSSGTARIRASVRGLGTREISYPVSRSSGATFNAFSSWRSGTLAKAATDAIDDRLAAFTSANGRVALFSTVDHPASNYVRSTSLWASGIDFTCLAACVNGSDQTHGGTAITPRHIALANHYPLEAGHTLRFVTPGNVVVNRTVSSTLRVGLTDTLIAKLDSDLPATITPAKLLPVTWATKLPNLQYRIPVAFSNQFKQLLVREWYAVLGTINQQASFAASTTTPRSTFGGAPIDFDSGSPVFLLVGTTPVLLTCWLTVYGGPNYAAQITEINSALTTLGGGYQASTLDVSGYSSF